MNNTSITSHIYQLYKMTRDYYMCHLTNTTYMKIELILRSNSFCSFNIVKIGYNRPRYMYYMLLTLFGE